MGCSVSSEKVKYKHNIKLEVMIQKQIQNTVEQLNNKTDNSAEELSVFDPSLDKEVKVPKLRSPIFNSLVQRRKMQQIEDVVL